MHTATTKEETAQKCGRKGEREREREDPLMQKCAALQQLEQN